MLTVAQLKRFRGVFMSKIADGIEAGVRAGVSEFGLDQNVAAYLIQHDIAAHAPDVMKNLNEDLKTCPKAMQDEIAKVVALSKANPFKSLRDAKDMTPEELFNEIFGGMESEPKVEKATSFKLPPIPPGRFQLDN